MDKMNLYKCAQALSVKWKSFFGLGIDGLLPLCTSGRMG